MSKNKIFSNNWVNVIVSRVNDEQPYKISTYLLIPNFYFKNRTLTHNLILETSVQIYNYVYHASVNDKYSYKISIDLFNPNFYSKFLFKKKQDI